MLRYNLLSTVQMLIHLLYTYPFGRHELRRANNFTINIIWWNVGGFKTKVQHTWHSSLELWVDGKKVASYLTMHQCLGIVQASKWAQKQNFLTSPFWVIAILRFLPYKAKPELRGKISKWSTFKSNWMI